MPRIKINGVIWNRTSDKILKSGVQQSRLKRWKRISNRLPTKPVQNCIDRWEGGLNRSCEKITSVTKKNNVHLPIIDIPAYESSCTDSEGTHEDGPDLALVDARQRLVVRQNRDVERMARYKRFAVRRRQSHMRKRRQQEKGITSDEYPTYSEEPWLVGYSSSENKDSLTDWSSGMHQRHHNDPEGPSRFDDFLDNLLGNGVPVSMRTRVITLPEPSFNCTEFWHANFTSDFTTNVDLTYPNENNVQF